MPDTDSTKTIVKIIASLLQEGAFESHFKSKALAAGLYLPNFKLVYAGAPLTQAPTKAPTKATNAPTEAPTTPFCQVGKIDVSGSCECADKDSCEGPGCQRWELGSWYVRH